MRPVTKKTKLCPFLISILELGKTFDSHQYSLILKLEHYFLYFCLTVTGKPLRPCLNQLVFKPTSELPTLLT